jgi:hypothetical protein
MYQLDISTNSVDTEAPEIMRTSIYIYIDIEYN